MAWQRPTRLVMGPCIVEIDRIVISSVSMRIKDNFGWAGRPMIDCIVIKEVQYQFEVNWCRNEEIIVNSNFGWAWPMWAGCPRVGNGAMHKVQYQFEVNRCRNEEIIVKGNFGWAWPMWAGRLRIVNQCRNEEIVKGNFGWVICGRGLLMGPCIADIDRIVIREVQYQFEVNRCRNKEIIVKGNFGWAWSMCPGLVMGPRKAQYQFEVNRCRNDEVNEQVARTDGQTHLTTISPLFLRKTWG
ncbi:hypothetical protein DPMN_161427 [Dreissena polymorpha]|uniref:Uncharacterized protein n=1 Tax=Dreissena polymorpha TaxID=45954 RepID=A0A9D4EMP0_DREPO|nr:hypothetical protein DPMN_161427 [Dreissena polymorpha]